MKTEIEVCSMLAALIKARGTPKNLNTAMCDEARFEAGINTLKWVLQDLEED
jgi:hypothetical protein